MFKTALACAALAIASAQNLQQLANQANAALGPLLNQENPVVQHDHSLSLNVDNYEWTLTEQGNEYEFHVNQLAGNANNLAPALAALLANVGNVAQNNNNNVDNLLATEAQSVGVHVEDNGLAGNAANQGAQAAQNSEALSAAVASQYNQIAAALAENTNGITTQVNQQLNGAADNQNSVSDATNNAVNTAINNAVANENLAGTNLNDLPVQVSGTGPLANDAAKAAANVNTNQAAANLGDLTNQGLNAGANAANTNLPNGLADAVSGAASNAANSVSNSLNAAVNSANANALNGVNSANNFVNGQ